MNNSDAPRHAMRFLMISDATMVKAYSRLFGSNTVTTGVDDQEKALEALGNGHFDLMIIEQMNVELANIKPAQMRPLSEFVSAARLANPRMMIVLYAWDDGGIPKKLPQMDAIVPHSSENHIQLLKDAVAQLLTN